MVGLTGLCFFQKKASWSFFPKPYLYIPKTMGFFWSTLPGEKGRYRPLSRSEYPQIRLGNCVEDRSRRMWLFLARGRWQSWRRWPREDGWVGWKGVSFTHPLEFAEKSEKTSMGCFSWMMVELQIFNHEQNGCFKSPNIRKKKWVFRVPGMEWLTIEQDIHPAENEEMSTLLGCPWKWSVHDSLVTVVDFTYFPATF